MIESKTPDYSLFDTLIEQNLSFSVFRLPTDTTLTLVVQEVGLPDYLQDFPELNGKEGFLIAPFENSDRTPFVLLHPDGVFEKEKEIMPYLEKMKSGSASIIRAKDELLPVDASITYQKAFELFQTALRSNVCEKMVLSRTLDKAKPEGFSAGKTFKAACDNYPEAFVYLCHTPMTGTWLGSSPELLLSGEKTRWQTVALAGTIKVTDSEWTRTDLTTIWDEKNIREQHIVSNYIGKQLELSNLAYVENGPFTAKAGRLAHLKTEFSFEMDGSSHIGDLLESLHPTPAVCGFPKKTAYRLILKKEGYDRKYYSGFIGPLSMNGKTDLFVNLRCMEIKPDKLTFYAGGGLMPDSNVESEWLETEEKMQTMLSLIDFNNE